MIWVRKLAVTPHLEGVGRFDRSGHLSVLLAGLPDCDLAVALGDGTGGFRETLVKSNLHVENSETVIIGDMNHDGCDDLTVIGDEVRTYWCDGNGGFVPSPMAPYRIEQRPSMVAFADLNHDRVVDAVLACKATDAGEARRSIYVEMGQATGQSRPMRGSPFPAGRGTHAVAVGDVNGDDVPDIVVANDVDNTLTVLEGADGTMRVAATIDLKHEPELLAVADLNGGRRDDIIVVNQSDSKVTILFSQ
ncbi:MAG TPA: VCBS repeat-containing protein [Candidatus Didemnitutus sp.]|nr:VCBS repeat-containing protein [Candidatus Didemnitutus sp.]